MRAILAPGWGKLHFHETARALAEAGVEINFLTGWAPGPRQAAMVDLLGRLLGEQNLAKRMEARRIDIPGAEFTAIPWVEFAGWLVAIVQRTGLLPLDLAYGMEFRIAGWGSRPHLKNADVLLVRSGAGQSGAIKTARKNGLAVVTDHSIAHPQFIHEVLRHEFDRYNLRVGYNPKADLWKLVLRDCAEADLLLVNSDFVKETFLAYGYPAEKIRVAYLGVRDTFFNLKSDYGIHGPVKLLLTGNFDIRKGVRVLLEAIRKCRKTGLDVRLNLIGNMGNGEACLEASDARFFTHTPFVPPEVLAHSFADADLFVFPTFAEGSSRSGMEAAAAGLPVITTKNCGLPLEHGISAIYIPVDDSDSLAQAIAQISSNQPLRESLGRSAAKTVTENYTWAHYGRQVAKVLNEAVSAKASGGFFL